MSKWTYIVSPFVKFFFQPRAVEYAGYSSVYVKHCRIVLCSLRKTFNHAEAAIAVEVVCIWFK